MEIHDIRYRPTLSSFSGNSSIGAYISRFGLCFADESRKFHVGGTVDGSVLVSLNSPIVIRRIRVYVDCKIKVDPQMQEPNDYLNPSPTSVDVSQSNRMEQTIFSSCCTPFGDELDYMHHVDGENFVLRSGNYEYIFQIPLSKDLPPSVNNAPCLSISYICTATVECGQHCERIVESAKSLLIVRDHDLKDVTDSSWKEPHNLSKVIDISEFFPTEPKNDGSLKVDIWLNQKGVVVGKVLRFSGFIANNSDLPLTEVEASIVQVIERNPHAALRLVSKSSSVSSKISNDSSDSENIIVNSVIASLCFGRVRRGKFLALGDGEIRLPSDHTVVPSGDWMQRSFRCSYRFAIKLVLKSQEELHIVTLAIPLEVGTMFSGNQETTLSNKLDDVFTA